MPGRKREPSFQLASGTTNERDNSYNISNTLGSIFYNTDTSNVEIRHEDPSNNVGWRDLVMNNKEQIDISGKLVVDGDVSFNAHLSAVDASFQNNVDIIGNITSGGIIQGRTGKIIIDGANAGNFRVEATGLNYSSNLDIVACGRTNYLNQVGGFNRIFSEGSASYNGALRFWKMSNNGVSYLTEYLRLTPSVAQFSGQVSPGSDDRIKINEKLILNATETLIKLTPQIYDRYLDMDLSGENYVESGLIAQEVYYNAPELRHLISLGAEIDGSGNEYTPTPDEMDLSGVDIGSDPDYGSHGWSKTEHCHFNYNGLIPYLIKSNQELHERILKLENK